MKYLILLSLILPFSIMASRLPFAEYSTVKYVAFSANESYQSAKVKRKILENAQKDIIYLIYYSDERERDVFLNTIKDLMQDKTISSQVRLIKLPSYGETLWPTDSFPNLVIDQGEYKFIDSRYYEGFEPDKIIADMFNTELERSGITFEHGNLVSNAMGDCYVVKEIWANRLEDDAFDVFGCKSLTRLEWKYGIGHADEILKFLSDDVVVTMDKEIIPMLKAKGYKVHLLPKAPNPPPGVMPQRSYVNSLQINDTIYVPQYKNALENKVALKVYESLGFKVIGIDTTYTSDYGGGALHCLTKTYPSFK